jgi:hypothetical protein
VDLERSDNRGIVVKIAQKVSVIMPFNLVLLISAALPANANKLLAIWCASH